MASGKPRRDIGRVIGRLAGDARTTLCTAHHRDRSSESHHPQVSHGEGREALGLLDVVSNSTVGRQAGWLVGVGLRLGPGREIWGASQWSRTRSAAERMSEGKVSKYA